MPDFHLVLTLLAALGSGLIAGTFFAFSNFVMAALADQGREGGIRAMQAINRRVLNPGFLGTFLGTALVAALSVYTWISDPELPGALWVGLGGVLYFVGTFLVTGLRNVPLNDRLATADSSAASSEEIWTHYLRAWTRWNHLRTIAAALALVCFTYGLALWIP